MKSIATIDNKIKERTVQEFLSDEFPCLVYDPQLDGKLGGHVVLALSHSGSTNKNMFTGVVVHPIVRSTYYKADWDSTKYIKYKGDVTLSND